ncbi:MAG: hypothetical protein LBN27_02560 [Prevotellaceae bacterium]|nr:hypothetical protein [Prevotellaceae bacterium]
MVVIAFVVYLIIFIFSFPHTIISGGTCISLFVFTEIIIISTRYTKKVSISEIGVTITYYQFLRLKLLTIPFKNAIFELSKKKVYQRLEHFYVIKIFQNNKMLYEIDSRDGFEEFELIDIKKKIDQITSKSATCA